MKLGYLALLGALAFSGTAAAVDYMSADEVKAAFSDKTLDGLYVPKDKKFKIYEAPDGTHHVLRPSGKRDKNREWSVNEKGQHCTTSKKWDGWRCSFVENAGNGVYKKYNDDGEHTHTLSNPQEGNQL